MFTDAGGRPLRGSRRARHLVMGLLTMGLLLSSHVSSAPAASCTSENTLVLDKPPVLSGKAEVGAVLKTTTGTWRACGGATITYEYRWYSGSAGIPGATGSTYTVTPSDAGYGISALITARAQGGGIMDASSNTITIPGTPLAISVSGPLTQPTVEQAVHPIPVTSSGHPIATITTYFDGALQRTIDLPAGSTSFSGDVGPYDARPSARAPGPHTVDVVAADPGPHSVTRTLSFRIVTPPRFVHAQSYTADPAAGGELIGDEWADPNSSIARWQDYDTIATHDTVTCAYAAEGCAEYRMRSRDSESDPTAGDIFVRYRGVSGDDERIEDAGELREFVAYSAGMTPDGQGPIGDVKQAWQTLPPGAGTTYISFDTTELTEMGGTAPDGPDGNEVDTPQDGDVTTQTFLDAQTRLPILEETRAPDGSLLFRRYWTYSAALLRESDLPSDFFSVARPDLPEEEKVVEYQPVTTMAATAEELSTGAVYDRLNLGPQASLDDGRFCRQGQFDETLIERPPDNQIRRTSHDMEGDHVSVRTARTLFTYVRQRPDGRCPQGIDPGLIVRTTAKGSTLAHAWKHAYAELGTPFDAQVTPPAFGTLAPVTIQGDRVQALVLRLGGRQKGLYLERGATATVITGPFEDAEADQLVSQLEVR